MPAVRIWLIVGLAVALSAIFVMRQFSGIGSGSDGIQFASVELGGRVFRLELARTPENRARGLGGRDYIGADEGMLFIFDGPAPRTFWMKDMLIPIDIIWLSDGIIIGIDEKVYPPALNASEGNIARVSSPAPADTVIEIGAGRASELGLVSGQRAEILIP